MHPKKPVAKSIQIRRWLVLAILALMAGYGAGLAWNVVGLYRALTGLQAAAEVRAHAALPDLADRAAGRISALRWWIAPLFPILDVVELFPGVGPYAGQVEPLAFYGTHLSRAGAAALRGFAPLLEGDLGSGEDSLSEQAAALLALNQATFQVAANEVDAAAVVRDDLRLDLLPEQLEAPLRKIDDRFGLLQGALGLLAEGGGLAGVDEPRVYLVVVQNHDELRATGGFISAFGLLEIAGSKVTRFDFQDSYAVDDYTVGYPAPPEPLRRYMLAGLWVPRDANWSADFPTAAADIQRLYTLSTGVETDGVIALDQVALAALLEALGPVTLDAVDGPVTASNVSGWMERAWSPEPEEGVTDEWWQSRKDFMGQLAGAMMERLMNTDDPAELFAVVYAALETAQAGHLLMYFNQPEEQAAISRAGLDGGVHPGEGDFLLLVDSNLGFNKADALVERSVTYAVDLSDPSNVKASLRVSYASQAQEGVPCVHEAAYGMTYADLQQRCYWDYWRVLAAPGSQWISSEVQVVPGARLLSGRAYGGDVDQATGANGTTEFSGLVMVPTGQVREFSLGWQLPPGVIRRERDKWVYTLRIQKQPGLDELPVRISVWAPDGAQLQPQPGWQQAGGASGNGFVVEWSGSVTEPVEFTLEFVRD